MSLIAALAVVFAYEIRDTSGHETEWQYIHEIIQDEDEFGHLIGEFRFTGAGKSERTSYSEGATAWRCRVRSPLRGTAQIQGQIRQSSLDESATVSASCESGYLVDRGGVITFNMPARCTCYLRDAGGSVLTRSGASLKK